MHEFVIVNTTGICIQVISEQDCRRDFVDLSRQIAEQCESNELSIDEIDSYSIGSRLKGRFYISPSFATTLIYFASFSSK